MVARIPTQDPGFSTPRDFFFFFQIWEPKTGTTHHEPQTQHSGTSVPRFSSSQYKNDSPYIYT